MKTRMFLVFLIAIAVVFNCANSSVMRVEILAIHTGNPFSIVTRGDYYVCVRFTPPITGASYRSPAALK